jgi:hypothetical protein
MKWKKEPGTPGVQAPISHGGSTHDYVISHRTDQHTVSYRPPGKHEHVGTFTTEKAAKAAAVEHAKGSRSHVTHATKKTPAQLNREIAHALSGRSSRHSTKGSAYDKDDARGGFTGSSRSTRCKHCKTGRCISHSTKHATTRGVSETMFAVEIDRSEFTGDRNLPADARWREDLAHLAEEELGRGRTYRRPAKARYGVIEWTGYRGEVGKLLDWMEAAPGITRYAEIFE